MKTIEFICTLTMEDNSATTQIYQAIFLEGNNLKPIDFSYNSSKKYFESRVELKVRENRRYLNTILEINAQGGTGWKFEAFDTSLKTSLIKEEGKTGDKSPIKDPPPANQSQRFITIDLKKLP
nr:hypothetical protein [Allomuricauda sp.]